MHSSSSSHTINLYNTKNYGWIELNKHKILDFYILLYYRRMFVHINLFSRNTNTIMNVYIEREREREREKTYLIFIFLYSLICVHYNNKK